MSYSRKSYNVVTINFQDKIETIYHSFCLLIESLKYDTIWNGFHRSFHLIYSGQHIKLSNAISQTEIFQYFQREKSFITYNIKNISQDEKTYTDSEHGNLDSKEIENFHIIKIEKIITKIILQLVTLSR